MSRQSRRQPTDEVGARTRTSLKPAVILERGLKELVSAEDTKHVIQFSADAPLRKVEAIVDFLTIVRELAEQTYDELNFIPLLNLRVGQKVTARNLEDMKEQNERILASVNTSKTLLDNVKILPSLGYAMKWDHREAVGKKRKAENLDRDNESEDDGGKHESGKTEERATKAARASSSAARAHSDDSEVDTDVMPGAESEDEGDDDDDLRFSSPRPKSPKSFNWGSKKQRPDCSDEDEEEGDELDQFAGDRSPAPPPADDDDDRSPAPPADDGVPDFEWIDPPANSSRSKKQKLSKTSF